MTHSHSRQCFNIAPRLGWILANTSTSLHSDDCLAVKHRLILMLQSHSLDNLKDECRQRAKARRLMAKSLQKRHENKCKCIEKPRNYAFFGDGSHHYRTEEEESFATSGVKARNGKRSPKVLLRGVLPIPTHRVPSHLLLHLSETIHLILSTVNYTSFPPFIGQHRHGNRERRSECAKLAQPHPPIWCCSSESCTFS